MVSFTRRDFVGAALAAPMAAVIQTSKNRSLKPNLLFLWADEQRPDTMAVYGNRKIHTPFFNRFALTKDPEETHNLFYSGEYKQTISRLSKRIEDWQAGVRDTVSLS